jgi:uncharacterized membrane protein
MDEQRLFNLLEEMNKTLKEVVSQLEEVNSRFARYENELADSDEMKRIKEG